MSSEVIHSRQMPICSVLESDKFIILGGILVDFIVSTVSQQLHVETNEHWGHTVAGLVFSCDENILLDSIFIKLWNTLLYHYQLYQNSNSVQDLELDYIFQYFITHTGIILYPHNIWV